MKIIIDIDGTICTEENFDNRKNARPFKKAIKNINIFKKKGYPPVQKFATEFADGILF